MRRTLPSLFILAAIVVLLAAPFPGRAQPGPPPGPPEEFLDDGPGPPLGPPDRFFAEHAQELGIDQATLDQIRAILDAARTDGHTLHDRVRSERRAMHDLLDQATPDEAAVMAEADVVGDAMTALHKHRLATMLKIRALLTLEQRDKLKELRREHGPWKRHGGPFGKGPR
jgi:Spy/CpxP family protein refolding chaperone